MLWINAQKDACYQRILSTNSLFIIRFMKKRPKMKPNKDNIFEGFLKNINAVVQLQLFLVKLKSEFLYSFLSCPFEDKKRGKCCCICLFSPYDRFLIIRTASTTPIITITIITAAIPNSRLPADAKPVTGAAVGGAVGGGVPA